jgi:DNA-binding HxlR family transcriptional regulator
MTEQERLHKEKLHEECHMRDKCMKHEKCPMILVQKLVAGKWKILILWYLSYNTLRFNDIKRKLEHVTQKMLTQQLRGLEEDKLIYRRVYPVVPPRVEYGLTDLGRKIIPVLELMHEFGADYLEKEFNMPKYVEKEQPEEEN